MAEGKRREPQAALPPPDSLEVLVHSRHFVRWKQILIAFLTAAFSGVAGLLALYADARYSIAAVGTMALCIGVAMFPQLGFWLYYLIGFSRPQEVFWGLGELRISLALAGVTLAAWIAYSGLNRRRFLRPEPLTWLMLAFGLIVVVSGLVHGGDWNRVIDLVKILLMALATASYMTKRSFVRGFWGVLTFAFAFLSLWGLWQHFITGYPEITGPGMDGDGLLYDRNAYAMFLVMGIPFYWYLGQRARLTVLRFALWAMIPATTYAVLLTSSRGGLLGLAAVFAALGWNTRHRYAATIAGLVLFAGFYMFLAPSGIKDRAGTIVEYEEEASAMGRILSWQTGLSMMAANPIFGIGPNKYVESYSAYSDTYARQAHNCWVQAGAEYGVPGLVVYFLLVWITMKELLRLRGSPRSDPELRRWANMLIASMVGYLVCGFFLSMEGFELFYLYVALTIVLRYLHRLRVRELAAG